MARETPARRSSIRPRTWPRPWLPTERARKPPQGHTEAVASAREKAKVRRVSSQTRRFPTRREAPSSGSRKVPLSGRPSPGCGPARGVGGGRGGPARPMWRVVRKLVGSRKRKEGRGATPRPSGGWTAEQPVYPPPTCGPRSLLDHQVHAGGGVIRGGSEGVDADGVLRGRGPVGTWRLQMYPRRPGAWSGRCRPTRPRSSSPP